MSTPRGHLRPDKMGRERPPSKGSGAALGGGRGGRSRPQLAFHHHPRGVPGGIERRRFPMTARAHPLACQRVAASASLETRHHYHRGSAV